MTRSSYLARGWSATWPMLLLLLIVSNSSQAQGLDRVRLRNGVQSGKITKMTPLALTLTKGGVDNKVPVEEIVSLTFAGEPKNLAPARRNLRAGQLENALAKLKKIDLDEVERPAIAQEIDFLTAQCNALLAIAGQGRLAPAKQQITTFLTKNNKNYRVPAAIELYGDLLLAQQDYDNARAQYRKLGKAPAPYYQSRSALLIGRLHQAEAKHQEALTSFDQALQVAAGNAVAESQIRAITLHRSISQAALGKVATATDAVKQIITQTDPQDTLVLAQAYNALGDCYLQAQEKKAARQAYLHVDLLFSASATEHAKALYELSELWEALGNAARARDASQRLKKQYPASRWAKK